LKLTRFGLITRIALLVVCVEVAAFSTLGWFYIDQFSGAVDENIRSRLRLVGRMIGTDELAVSAISRPTLLSELVGAPYLGGMAIGGNGRVIVSTDPAYLGHPASSVPDFDPRWLAESSPDEQFIVGKDSLTGVMHIHNASAGAPIYYTVLRIDTAELNARKRAIAWWGQIGSLLFILFSSAAIVLIAQRLITRRVRKSLAVLKEVEEGDLDARIAITAYDELGQLQHGINSMTAKVGTLLGQHRRNAEELKKQKELLQSILEHAPIRVFWKDAALRYLGCNSLFAHDAGLGSPDALLGKSDFDLGWRDQAERYRADDLAVMASGLPKLDFEEPQTTPDGHTIWLSTSKVPLLGEQDQVIGVIGIYTDITERKRNADELERHRHHLEQLVAERTGELSRAKEAAEAANRAKSVFLANMSHELRTPLNAILGYAQLLTRDERIPEEDRKSLATINRAGGHLLSLINDVLEITRIEAGRTTVENETFDLDATLVAVEEMARLRAEAKGLALVVQRQGDLPAHVAGDAHHLRQVLINLLGNAVKYTDRGQVSLHIEAVDDRHIRFEVRDTGPGITETEQERIFNAFYQTPAGVAKGEGTGLGLTISREFVQLMGGELSLESTPGKGSTFRFTIPLPAAAAPAKFERHDRVIGIEPGQPVCRHLVVDDHQDNRDLAIQMLKSVGFEVYSAEDGQKAVAQFEALHPDFIWMDMRMPVMDGYAATRRIRALPGGDKVKIVALTASAFEEDRGAIIAAGCDEVVRKPVEEARLFEVMAKLLGLRFLYADETPAAEPTQAIDLSRLPAAWRAELAHAATRLDREATQALVERLRADYPDEADRVLSLVENYRYDQLLALCTAP